MRSIVFLDVGNGDTTRIPIEDKDTEVKIVRIHP